MEPDWKRRMRARTHVSLLRASHREGSLPSDQPIDQGESDSNPVSPAPAAGGVLLRPPAFPAPKPSMGARRARAATLEKLEEGSSSLSASASASGIDSSENDSAAAETGDAEVAVVAASAKEMGKVEEDLASAVLQEREDLETTSTLVDESGPDPVAVKEEEAHAQPVSGGEAAVPSSPVEVPSSPVAVPSSPVAVPKPNTKKKTPRKTNKKKAGAAAAPSVTSPERSPIKATHVEGDVADKSPTSSPQPSRVATRASNEVLFQQLLVERDALLHDLDRWRGVPKDVASVVKYASSARQAQLQSARDLHKFGDAFAGLVPPGPAEPHKYILESEFTRPLLRAGSELINIADIRRASAAEWGASCVAPFSAEAMQNSKLHSNLDRACRIASSKIISAAQAERKQVGIPGRNDGSGDQIRSEDITFGEHLNDYVTDMRALARYHAAERDILLHSWLEQAIGALAAERAAAAAHAAALDAAFASVLDDAHRRMQGRTSATHAPVNVLRSRGFDLDSLPSLSWQAPAVEANPDSAGHAPSTGTLRKGVFRRGRSQTAESAAAAGLKPSGEAMKPSGPERTRTVSMMHSNIVYEGYLTKRGAVRKNWKRRYFVLDSDKLAYYTSETTKSQPIARIYRSTASKYRVENIDSLDGSGDEVDGDAVVDDRGNKLKPFAGREHLFCLIEPSRTWFFQAETASERAHWVKALRHYFCGTAEHLDAAQELANEGKQQGEKSVTDVYRSQKDGVRTYSTRALYFMDKPSELAVPSFGPDGSELPDRTAEATTVADGQHSKDAADPAPSEKKNREAIVADLKNYEGTPLGNTPWRLYYTPDGIEFFTNIHTNETVWERPEI